MLDTSRQARFLYPPAFFIGSVAWGLYLDQELTIGDVFPGATLDSSERIVALGAVGGIVLICMGFIIGSVSIGLLNLLFWWRGKTYEASLDEDSLDRIHRRLNIEGGRQSGDTKFLSATLDHVLIPESIHLWVFRRWSMFYVATHSAVALVLALVIGGPLLGISIGLSWFFESLCVFVLLVLIARWAWWDTMGMLDFQSRVRPSDPEDSDDPSLPPTPHKRRRHKTT